MVEGGGSDSVVDERVVVEGTTVVGRPAVVAGSVVGPVGTVAAVAVVAGARLVVEVDVPEHAVSTEVTTVIVRRSHRLRALKMACIEASYRTSANHSHGKST
jgi:hypothetical protein